MKILLKIMYDGSGYCGFQYQPTGRSIQGVLTECVSKAFGLSCLVTGCSRTDAGVHALGYCALVEPQDKSVALTEWCSVPDGKIHRLLNVVLPDDICVIGAARIDADFHPRYNAIGKEYLYKFRDAVYPDPFTVGKAYHVKRPLGEEELAKMNEAAKFIVGRHDFASFMASGSSITDTVREIYSLEVRRASEFDVEMRISGNGFLYNMVRIIAGTLLDVAYGKISPAELPEIIESKDRSLAGATAPAHGLYLSQVFYDREIEFSAN